MFRLYEKHRVDTPSSEANPKELCPVIDITEYLPNTVEQQEGLHKKLTTKFVDDLFRNQTKLDRKKFVEKLAT